MDTHSANYRLSADRKLLYMSKVNVIGFRTESMIRKKASMALTSSDVVVNTSLSRSWNALWTPPLRPHTFILMHTFSWEVALMAD